METQRTRSYIRKVNRQNRGHPWSIYSMILNQFPTAIKGLSYDWIYSNEASTWIYKDSFYQAQNFCQNYKLQLLGI